MNKKILFIDNDQDDQVLFKKTLRQIADNTTICLSAYIAIEKFNPRCLNKGLISPQNNLGL